MTRFINHLRESVNKFDTKKKTLTCKRKKYRIINRVYYRRFVLRVKSDVRRYCSLRMELFIRQAVFEDIEFV